MGTVTESVYRKARTPCVRLCVLRQHTQENEIGVRTFVCVCVCVRERESERARERERKREQESEG